MIIFHPLLNSLGAIIQFIKHQSDEDVSWIKRKIYNWFLSNAQSLVLMAIVVIGIYLGFKREFSKLIGFLVVALVAVGLVFNASGVKDVLLQLFNKIIEV